MVQIELKNSVIHHDMEYIFNGATDWEWLYNKTILITGAYGMIASYLTAYLAYLNENHGANITILAVGRDSDKMSKRFGELNGREYFKSIIADVVTAEIDFQGVDYVIHAASAASPDMYAKIPVEVAAANALGTFNLLDRIKNCSILGFLMFSSGDVYGKVENCEKITENMMGIMDPLELHSCYGESKRMAETWCSLFWHEYGIPTHIARIGHTYGPTIDIDNDPRVFSSFMKSLINETDIVMRSDGSAKRPFCYITDAILAYFLILQKGNFGEAYNVCNTQQFLSVRELAYIILGIRNDLDLKVIVKDNSSCCVENKLNIENCPVEDKLIALGWKHEVTAKEGFTYVYKYLKSWKENK